MISRSELDRLAILRSEVGIVSAYITIEPRLMYGRSRHEAQFQGAVKRFMRRTKDPEARSVMERESGRILDFLRDWRPSGRGLAIFSCQPAQIWEVVHLNVRVPSFVDVDATTHTAILAQVLDEYPRFIVAVVQQDRASIYVAEQRSAEEEAEIETEVLGRHDQGGSAQARFQRHTEAHVERHLHKVVDELQQLYYDQPFKRLAVGGTEETVNELLKMLPDPIDRRVIGTFHVDFKHESEEAVLDRAREVLREDERRSERELVEKVVAAAEAGGHGAVGIDDTLRAVNDGRVETLLVAEGVTLEGWACRNCDYFAAGEFQRCLACGGETQGTSDVIERAVEQAYLTGAHIETVFGEGREWLLARGGLGAVLRY